MAAKKYITFPCNEHFEQLKKNISEINGETAIDQVKNWESGNWTADVYCSTGAVFEKSGVAMVKMAGAMVEGTATDISLLQTLTWPSCPGTPGLIIMISTGRAEDQNSIVTFYTDLIIQNGDISRDCRDLFTGALKTACERYGQSIEEYQSLLAGRGMLGECAAECGMLYFFEESDVQMLEDIIRVALAAYRDIIHVSGTKASADEIMTMKNSRKKIVDWMLSQDYGVKVSRQNGIPLDVIEAYGFPPSVQA